MTSVPICRDKRRTGISQPPLVDDTVLRVMRPGAWLVNIARGALLDTAAAIAHLDAGHLAGIGLDVFPTEPYPADGPLVGHPRIVATSAVH